MHWPLGGFAMLAASLMGPKLFGAVSQACGAFAFLFAGVSAFAGWRFLRGLDRRAPAVSMPPVTILKPLKGAESALYENLETFCRLDYPCYQLVFCLHSPEDPAMGVVARLKKDFPDADIEIVVSKSRIGYNPKVNNMANGYPFAKYDLLLMSDSDIAVEPDFLRRMVSPLTDPGVGVVTAFYQATGARGLWRHMEALSINAEFLPQALCAAAFGMRFAMGAAMLVRRQAFEESGAFHNLADHLADDFWLGESVREAGWKLEVAGVVVDTVPDISAGGDHFRHLVRWSRTIRICQPLGHAASLIQHGFSLLTLKVLLFGPDRRSLILLAAILAAKTAAAAVLGAGLGRRQALRSLWLLPLAEWFSFAAWLGAWGSSRVLWRGELFEVQPKGLLAPAGESAARRRLAHP